eukprot:TRINITY_DN1215_c0_g1_i1.p1 TRINITY_DN1215_c0_g1~~TRINITY_DN1215_c0_g1_i1.p1  ORF type:complete len:126 (+),score=26.43 TRINITY_DN1215_c0_g1_i1:77-454(+)
MCIRDRVSTQSTWDTPDLFEIKRRKANMQMRSKEEELKVLNNLLRMAKEKMLNEEIGEDLILSQRQRDSYKIVSGEQRSLKVMVEMIEAAVKILNELPKIEAAKYCCSLNQKPYSRYLEQLIALL